MTVMEPVKPLERKVSTARTPANDAPTMTIFSTAQGYELATSFSEMAVMVVS
jgi:hypothetical protein